MNIEGIFRRFYPLKGGKGEIEARFTGAESLAVAQTEGPGVEMSRAGRRFYGGAVGLTGGDVSGMGQGSAVAATGRAPVAAMPTTLAAFELWNGEAAGGRSLIIDSITIAQLSGTAAVGAVLLVALTKSTVVAPTAAAGYGSASMSKGGLTTKAVWADNQTLATQPAWVAVQGTGNPATTTNGGLTCDLTSRPIIVPPGFALAIAVLSGTGTTPLFLGFASWTEVELDLE